MAAPALFEEACDDGFGTCSFCGEDIRTGAPQVLFKPHCGHGVHYACLRAALAACNRVGERLACKVCGCGDVDYLDVADLRWLQEEATEYFQDEVVTDLELRRQQELVLQRPLRCLARVPDVIFAFRGLRCLELSGFAISEMPASIGLLSSLRRLVLMSLNLEALPAEIGQLRHLNQLMLYGNFLRELPAELRHLENIWRLCLDSNLLITLPDVYPKWVENIELVGNRLETLPQSISECVDVVEIRACGNRLIEIPSLSRMARLRDCCLQGNALRSLPDELGSLPSLRYLGLSDNYLESLPASLCKLRKLEWLYVYNNLLRDLPPGLTSHLWSLERLCIEANPLSDGALASCLDRVPSRLRVGVDDVQAMAWQRASGQDLAPGVCVGKMLPWHTDRFYAKLVRASQLRQAQGPITLDREAADVLVVAFAASQAVPEWLGSLEKLLHATVRKGMRRNGGSVKEFCPTRGKEAAALWQDWCYGDFVPFAREPEEAEPMEPTRVRDFDVLVLCDTHVRWYNDAALERNLSEIASAYRRVLFLGVSMGGFGALLFSHLADTVAVFGPQIDLGIAHLRPSIESPGALAELTERMQSNVRTALARGCYIECHVAMEDHLLYAQRLLLPPACLIVHPIAGRIARLLERAGLLVPLLASLLAELQRPDDAIRPWAPSVDFAGDTAMTEGLAWEWGNDLDTVVTVTKWEPNGSLTLLSATGADVGSIAASVPKSWDWFCRRCGGLGGEGKTCCQHCLVGAAPPRPIAAPAGLSGVAKNYCPTCNSAQQRYVGKCVQCGGVIEQQCACCGRQLADGHVDQVTGQWNCEDCWAAFARLNADMQGYLPDQWYVPGGQRWAWAVDGIASGQYLDFLRKGKMQTPQGSGSWWVNGQNLEVRFGTPAGHWRLERTSKGFKAHLQTQCGDAASGDSSGDAIVQGWPMYGAPSEVAEAMQAA